MKRIYSTYEAKAKFSEIVRLVREEGERVTISYHGRPVAEIRPIEPEQGDAMAVRLRGLEARGVVVRGERKGQLRPLAHRPGALARFLAERNT